MGNEECEVKKTEEKGESNRRRGWTSKTRQCQKGREGESKRRREQTL